MRSFYLIQMIQYFLWRYYISSPYCCCKGSVRTYSRTWLVYHTQISATKLFPWKYQYRYYIFDFIYHFPNMILGSLVVSSLSPSWPGSFFPKLKNRGILPSQRNFLLSTSIYLEIVPGPGVLTLSESCLWARFPFNFSMTLDTDPC